MKASLSANTAISHYRVLSRLGAGGMGEVSLAEDTQLGRKVAIKLLPAESIADEQAKKRLVREARSAAKLDHPNICSIYEVSEEDGYSFIVMQYVEGETLASFIDHRPLELIDVLGISVQVAGALAEAHSHGIIHRDIKPQNIMIAARHHAKVMDFGLAKVVPDREIADNEAVTESLLTEPGAIVGTVPYMSPEQVKGEPIDARSDIFSFGTALYEMVSGKQPFAAVSAAATFSAILTHKPPPLVRYSREVPAELERIVSKTLRKDRDERYQTARDLLIDLKSLKHHLEFEAELERSTPPELKNTAAVVPEPITVEMISQTISHYRILNKLGAGGMGEVYLAEDTKLHRKVAIKFLPLKSIAEERAKRRLIREAQAAGTLDHPHICAIYEVNEEDGQTFIAMQYVEGESLASRIRSKPLELKEVLDIAVEVAKHSPKVCSPSAGPMTTQ